MRETQGEHTVFLKPLLDKDLDESQAAQGFDSRNGKTTAKIAVVVAVIFLMYKYYCNFVKD
ncbi:MAG: hypothetical protein KME55_34775 [Nostoc indistinguendum CM1-VF10]|jgi:hypothetical protein|nr:hypothetical protein [Nostoc indistinguendum CM1-VF10]